MLVMLVDDDEAILRMYSLYLKYLGCAVTTARDGEQAMQHLDELTDLPEVIVLDVRMRSMDGLETLDRLKARADTAAIPVILLAGDYIDPNDVPNAVRVLQKPMVPGALMEEIKSVLAASASG